MIRHFLYLCTGLVLFAIGFLSTSPTLHPDVGSLMRWGVGVFLFTLWIGFGFVFGVWDDLRECLARQKDTDRERWEHERRHLEASDIDAAEARHGALPADVKELYCSGRCLAEGIELGKGDEDDIFIETFIPIDLPFDNSFFPGLAQSPWLAIAHDGTGNVYAVRTDLAERDRTPLLFFDHEVGPEPLSTGLTVRDLLER